MDFEISDKMKSILELIDEFVDKELIPLEQEFVNNDVKAMMPVLEDKRNMVKKMELWAPQVPKEYGGMGLDLVEHGLVSESLGRTPLGHYVFGCQAPDAGNIEILIKYANDEQRDKYLLPLIQGKIRSCFSMTEVDLPGSNPVLLDATAVKDGNQYVINGHKWYSTAADGSQFSIVMA
ncbi:MAG TPA: acyl-CoA dehydrogenase family protein, partial [Spirochaetota bacterium]|nr:acyl-CoA dehydrogenase family protein [Spirochaetota bacterium]